MEKPREVSLEKLREEPYASVICYPKPKKADVEKRLKELQKLSVTSLDFVGEKEVFGSRVLGKGCVGIVVLANWKNTKIALKIRRVDADRARMQQEAKLLRMANSVNVGPKLLGVSRNFLLMEFVDGVLLPEWLEAIRKKEALRRVLREVLEQCWRLDNICLDHGELSHAPKHIIIKKKGEPVIVDFESASLNRKPSNVTSLCQFLFIGSATAKKIAEKLEEKARTELVETLRSYKKERSLENFGEVLMVCGL